MDDHAKTRLTDRKRASILEAAVAEFQTKGFYSSSMNRIAELASVSKRTLYNHFESKEALFEAIVQELLERSDEVPFAKFDGKADLATQLTELARSEVDFMGSNSVQALARAGLSRMLAEPDIGRQVDHSRFIKHVVQWIKQAKKSGKLAKIKDVEFASIQFTGLLKEFAFWPAIVKGSPPLSKQKRNKIVKETVEMFLARYQ